MKAKIKSVVFNKEYTNSFGTFYAFSIKYDDKIGSYSSKKREQTNFVEGQEAEFTEEKRTSDRGDWYIIKPIRANFQGQSGYAKDMKREQSKYSGFALAYAKDLLVAGKIESIEQMYAEAQCMVDWMVTADKELKS